MKKVYKVIFVIFIIISMYSLVYNVMAGNIWNDAGNFINRGAENNNGYINRGFSKLKE